MKKNFILFIFIISFYSGFAQETEISARIANHIAEIKDCNDFSCLDKILKNKRIVVLGESAHYDGTTLEIKVKLVKYMVEKLGFDVVGLEGLGFMESQFSSNLWRQAPSDFKNKFDIQDFDISKFWSPIWSQTKECQSLINAVNQNKIQVLGIDYYGDFLSKELFRILLNDFSTNNLKNIDFHKFEKFYYETLLYAGTEDHREIKENEYLWFLEKLMTMKNIAQRELEIGEKKKNAEVLLQLIKNTEALYRGYVLAQKKYISDEDRLIYGNNIRDQQMADNIMWYLDHNPKKKIIIWCANLHGVRNMTQAERLWSSYLMYSETKFMGEYLYEKYGNQFYSLAFTSSEWDSGDKADSTSLEYHIATRGVNYGFMDFTTLRYQNTYFNQPFQSYILMRNRAKWLNMFDGIYFIRKQKKSTPIVKN